MISFELQRKNMVESQVRPSDITDRRIMAAMLDVQRELYAAPDTRPLSYMDQDLPVGAPGTDSRRRALMAPRSLARMIQSLEIEPGDRVLEVGTATGYGASILARLAKSVIALEVDESLAAQARAILAEDASPKVKVVTGPLQAGWPAEAPYAAILVSGAAPEIPAAILDQLQDGGRLVAVVSTNGVGRLVQWRRIGSSFASRVVGEASGSPLPGLERAPGFVF